MKHYIIKVYEIIGFSIKYRKNQEFIQEAFEKFPITARIVTIKLVLWITMFYYKVFKNELLKCIFL